MSEDKKNGVVALNENNKEIECIDFKKIKGGKPFDTTLSWYTNMIQEINAI